MKKIKFLLLSIFSVLLLVCSTEAGPFTFGTNAIYYQGFEAAFRLEADGMYHQLDYVANPNIVLGTGDVFLGVMDVQNIDGASTHWNSITDGTISGIFAQEITALHANPAGPPHVDPYDPLQTSQAHIELGALSDHSKTFVAVDGSTFTTGMSGNEMFKFYIQDASSYTDLVTAGVTMAQSITTATDGGNVWMSLGVPVGAGYSYSHVDYGLTITPNNFDGETWSAVDVITNNTGWIFDGTMNDSFEYEMDIALTGIAGGLQNDVVMSSELEGNERFVQFGDSPWTFTANDPAWTSVSNIPEPTTMLLFGMGLLGLAGLGRKKA